MQKIITLTFLAAFTFALSGCVNRTVSKSSENRGGNSSAAKHGAQSDPGKVISEKRVWIWQDDFRNP